MSQNTKPLVKLTHADRNGASVILPDVVLAELGWRVGDKVELKVLGHQLKVSRVSRYQESQP